MIRFGKHIYINPLTLALFAFCFINRRAELLCVTYAVMTVHELSHLAAALAIGLKPSHITFHPFGVNLKLSNKIIYGLADEIILYAAGPLCNILLACGSAAAYSHYPYGLLRFFYTGNILLFCVNMLPAVPLDGGIILKKIISHRIGSRRAERVMRAVSVMISAALLAVGGYVVYVTKFNFSILLLAVFLAGSIFTQTEKYNIDFVRELMYYKNKPRSKIRFIAADKNDDPAKTAERFVPDKFSVVLIINKKGEIDDILTETQIIDRLIDERKFS